MRRSISTRLLITYIALATIPLLLVGMFLAWQSFTAQRQQAFVKQQQEAETVSAQVADFISSLESQLQIVLQTRGLQGLEREQQKIVLGQLMSFQNDFEELA